jgi:hypothetical protein
MGKASYFDDPIDSIEPIDLVPNGNRAISSATLPATITRACTRFREMAGLYSNGAVHCIRPDAGSNGHNPAAVRV